GERLPDRAAHRIDRAGGAQRGPHAALLAPQPLLVLPIESDPFADRRVGRRAVLAIEHELASDAPNLRIGEVGDQRAQRTRREALPRVRENQHVTAGREHSTVERNRLSPGWQFDELDFASPTREGCARLIRGTVRYDDDLARPGIVLLEKVGYAGRQPVRFVPRGDDDGDRRPTTWLERSGARSPINGSSPRGEQQRVARVNVEHNRYR